MKDKNSDGTNLTTGLTFQNVHVSPYSPITSAPNRNWPFTQSIELEPRGGTKHDTGKPRMDLIPLGALEEVGRVMAFGAKTYGDHNWASAGGFDYGRLLGATLRHLAAYQDGEIAATDSGLSHLAHATTNLLFLLHYERKGLGNNNLLGYTKE